MLKNFAGQKIQVFAFDYTTGAPKTGDAANITVYLKKDSGSLTALGDTGATEINATNAPGSYEFDLTQAESNADDLYFTGKSSTGNVAIVPQRVTTITSLMKRTNTAQAGAAAAITLDASASPADCEAGDLVYIRSGTGAGGSNIAPADMDNTTKIAPMFKNWRVQPDNTSVFETWKVGGATPADAALLATAAQVAALIASLSAFASDVAEGVNVSSVNGHTVYGAGVEGSDVFRTNP